MTFGLQKLSLHKPHIHIIGQGIRVHEALNLPVHILDKIETWRVWTLLLCFVLKAIELLDVSSLGRK